MQEEKEDRASRKAGSSKKPAVANDTKPYAGQGGMKKLLARRKMEIEQVEDKDADKDPHVADEDAMDEGGSSQKEPAASPADPPPIESSDTDWLSSNAAVSSTTGSTLRVGRSKTSRNHISRPASRPSKAKFSAAYEDADESMEQEEEERRKDREMLETAAKNVPAFNIATGFSFAKEV